MELEEIRNNVLAGKNIEDILKKFDWKKFEKIVAGIFENNDFKTIL